MRDLIVCREKEFKMRVYPQAEENVNLAADAIKFYSDDHGEPLLFHVLQPEILPKVWLNNQLYRSAMPDILTVSAMCTTLIFSR